MLVESCAGIGPKQASLFLRNIHFSDQLAVLDSHVLRFMTIAGILGPNRKSIGSIRGYEAHEGRLRDYASGFGWSIGCLDLGIWLVMRVCQQEGIA